MLTGKMVRVRYAKNQLIPLYLDTHDPLWLETAERLLDIYRSRTNSTRGELENEIRDTFDDAPSPQIYQGLAKLLEDRSEFAVVSDHPPEELRDAVFRAAVLHRQDLTRPVVSTSDNDSNTTELSLLSSPFDRQTVLKKVADELHISQLILEHGLFADLRSEQQMIAFKDISAERLLQRYNVSLAQSLLLRAVAVKVIIRDETPQRFRQLLRLVKFHRLMCEVEAIGDRTICLRLDGPLSLFSATQKYGLQLAVFLPAVLLCKDFEVQAELLWGPKKAAKKFHLTARDGLVSHYVDRGIYVPPELAMFVELFEKRIDDWEISQEPEMLPLGNSFWVPDFQLFHKQTGQVIYLDVLGFWRRSSVEKHLQLLRTHSPVPFVLAVSEQLHVEDTDLQGLSGNVMRFRQMPLPKEVVRVARELLDTGNNKQEKPQRKRKSNEGGGREPIRPGD